MRQLVLLAMLLSCFVGARAFAWGSIGHRVVGHLAQQRLSSKAQTKLRAILGKDSLADVSNWPDFVRSDPAWFHAAPWHYVSVPDSEHYGEKSKQHQPDNVVKKIGDFIQQLRAPKSTLQDQRLAVTWLVHLIGDLHQPLHVGREKDHGGNDLSLKWFGRDTNLHRIWDEEIIDMEKMGYTEYAAYIDKASPVMEKTWAKEPLPVWVEESAALRSLVYAFPPAGANFEFQYRFKVLETLNRRLLQAAVRLAATLEANLH